MARSAWEMTQKGKVIAGLCIGVGALLLLSGAFGSGHGQAEIIAWILVSLVIGKIFGGKKTDGQDND